MKLIMATVNARGMQQGTAFAGFLRAANRWRRRDKVAVVGVQEHNLDPQRIDEL